MLINTDALSSRYRAQSVDLINRRLLITNFQNTEQEQDLTEPANCEGFGRIRHFRRSKSSDWPPNPLPIDPACKALGLPPMETFRAQVFQNASCNWRCWYCFVPFDLLAANRKYSDWLTPERLVHLYLEETDPPPMIDLTGGQPDLVPEWVPWMMAELRNRGLEQRIYLWSDDNLSNDYFWRFLTDEDRELIATYKNYGRVCCFKGFNAESFSFNTLAELDLFDRQFALFGNLLTLGMDLYAYVTITTPSVVGLKDDVRRFFDRLQALDENLPLRTVPLEIEIFTPVVARLDEVKKEALKNQWLALETWQEELSNRFSSKDRALNIADIPLMGNQIKR
jgi:uncharacterized Fe-S cluster-containing radical SAM superfamily protein